MTTGASPAGALEATPLETDGISLDGPTRVGLVGTGFIADFHLEVLKTTPDIRLVAVCDVALERARRAATRYGIEHTVADLEALRDLEVQVIHLTTPPASHAALTRQALELGMGVFVEKPLALAAGEVRELAALAAERRLPLAVNHNNVFHPAFRRLVKRLRSGEIGPVSHVQVTLAVPLRQLDANDFSHWMFQAPRNIVFEQATHPLSQIHHLLGPVDEVHTTLLGSRELHPGQQFHHRWLIAARARGGTAELMLSFGEPFTRSTIQVLGSDGSLEADLFHDCLSGEQKTLHLEFWNTFLANHRRGGELRRDARRGLFGWIGSTLGLSGRSDPFFVGMAGSIRTFHSTLRQNQPFAGDAKHAVEVADWCDAVAADISAESPAPTRPAAPGKARPGEVVVLGATGFIGRRVVERLLGRGVPVTAIVRRLHSLPPEVSVPAEEGRLRLFHGSLGNPEGLLDALAGAESVIHLATGGGNTWDEVRSAMVEGSLQVAGACREQGIRRLVYVSSIAALDTSGQADILDSLDCDPRADQRPVYARGKIEAERRLLEFHGEQEIGLVIARPGVVLGAGTPMQHSGLGLWVRDNHCVGWGSGDHPLPVVLVDDVAEALVRAALDPGDRLSGMALNLCARPPLSARRIVDELARCTGRPIQFHPRSLFVSQTMEIGKWLVKLAGRRKGLSFPAYHDLAARALRSPISSDLARELLDWQPVEDEETFLDQAIRIHG